ncbi:cytochrome P450 [Hyaloscypha variabilis]
MASTFIPSYWQGAITLLLILLTYVISKGWHSRRLFYKLRQQGLPMPPWNIFTGNMLALLPLLKKFPGNAHQNYLITELSKDFTKWDSAFYLDLWPFSIPFLVINSPSLATQATQELDLPKPFDLDRFFRPFAGGTDTLFTLNGAEWKQTHAIFKPGFSASFILSQTDNIVRETASLVEILKDHATKGNIFLLDDLLGYFMMDIIGAVVLGSRLHSKRQFNQLGHAMRSQVRWHIADGELNIFKRWNPARPLVQWYNSRQMDSYVSKELDERFAERQKNSDAPVHSIIDLVLDNYIKENFSARTSGRMDPIYKKWLSVHIHTFLFSGHDSTASTIEYCYHLLSKHPEAMARIRAEHDNVFGPEPSAVGAQLLEQPQKINMLPYTTAVLKETMRLFPAASGVRKGQPNATLQDANGHRFPTEGVTILMMHTALHINPDYWKEPNSFIPERWLVGPEHPLYPVKGAWRPFEFGPRNCIGQTRVMQDVKTVLAMTVREFDVCAAYNEWDKLHPRKGLKTAWGERAYHVFRAAAHPADGFPCRVIKRK